MKLTWPLLGWIAFGLFSAAYVVFMVLGVLNETGVIDISWMPKSEESSGNVDPGGYNQGPNHVPARPGPPAGGGARGR